MNATRSAEMLNAAGPMGLRRQAQYGSSDLDADDHADADAVSDDADLELEDIGVVAVGCDAARPSSADSKVSEEQLVAWIERIVERDDRALTALYDATVSRTFGIVRSIVRSVALAEEVVEDTYFQVWRQAVRFDAGRGRALTWVLAMARSRAIDALRREARFQHDSLDDLEAAEPADQVPPMDDLLAAATGHAELHRALMRLNARPRQLLALAFFRGLSHEEIASQTELPLGTVKSQIRRALITLKQMLGDTGQQALTA